ncbi:MAG: Asp-tRNAAsn/Glu-tRNAGln amidotransferase C subunit [Chloroflexi bacterium]|nr:MAG: Asp-tRNAAsn/Glu-tRNAGln amidotransferase C subunit [Chloroflexota bacterium]
MVIDASWIPAFAGKTGEALACGEARPHNWLHPSKDVLMAELTKDAVRQMAALSGVQFSDEELDLMQPQVEAILEGITRVADIDLGDVEPHRSPRPVQNS